MILCIQLNEIRIFRLCSGVLAFFLMGVFQPPAILGAAEPSSTPRAENLPVRWQPFTKETFEDAAKRDLPVLLHVTAYWSHHSNVMMNQTFTHKGIADLINRLFVPVLIDRDQRPDLDHRYQEALQASSGSGGWPLTVVLTPDGDFISGGTFFSVKRDWVKEKPGMGEFLRELALSWEKDKVSIREQAREFNEQLDQVTVLKDVADTISKEVVREVVEEMRKRLDPVYGGFSRDQPGPRFPTPKALELALIQHARDLDGKSLEIATVTMNAMLRGGIHDRLGGGFHRFATDRFWRFPRFEKLLSTNAELLLFLAQLWQETRDDRFSSAAKGIIEWTLKVMYNEKVGGFHTSQSADASASDDGGYYTWSIKDLEAALPTEADCRLAHALFDIQPWGEQTETAPHKNVLCEVMDQKSPGSEDQPKESAADRQRIMSLMKDYRNRRKAPPVDRGVRVDDNARMISALLLAAQIWDLDEARKAALKSLDRIRKIAITTDQGTAHWITEKGEALHFGLGQDEAALAVAFQDAFLVTNETEYLTEAAQSIKRLDARFLDLATNHYLDRTHDPKQKADTPGRLDSRHTPFQDTIAPSLNALAVAAHLRQTELTSLKDGAIQAGKTLSAFGKLLRPLSHSGAGLLQGWDALEHGMLVVVVQGAHGDKRTVALKDAALFTYAPHKMVLSLPLENKETLKRMGFDLQTTAVEPVAHVRVGSRFLGSFSDERKLKYVLEVAGNDE